MRTAIITLFFVCHWTFAFANTPVSIPLPKVASHTEPRIAKFDFHGEKLFVGFFGAEINNAVVYDIDNRSLTQHCSSTLSGDLAAIANNGERFALRVKAKGNGRFAYEIRKMGDCAIVETFAQPKLQYPELLPQLVFNTQSERAIFVEARAPHGGGKAGSQGGPDVARRGFNPRSGRVLFFDINKKVVLNQFPTPSDYTAAYMDDGGLKLILIQAEDHDMEAIQCFSAISGKRLNLDKDSYLAFLQGRADGSWQFWVDFFSSSEIYNMNERDVPAVDEKWKVINFRTRRGNIDVPRLRPLLGSKFWLPVDDGKYVVFVGREENAYVVKIYSMLGH